MRRLAFCALVLVVVGSGCSSPTTEAGSFDLVEFEIIGPTDLPADTQSIDVANSGEFPHTLVVTDVAGGVAAATSLIQPGERVDLELDLEPGRYSFTCRIVAQTSEGDLVDHFEAGMLATVDVSR